MAMDKYKDLVEQYYKIKISDKSRQAKYVRARSIYYYLCERYTRATLREIGESVNRDRTTVLHAQKERPNMVRYDKRYKQEFDEILYMLANENYKIDMGLDELVIKYNQLLIENVQLKMQINQAKFGKSIV